jgi:Ca2+-binding RTX toxin-like protein
MTAYTTPKAIAFIDSAVADRALLQQAVPAGTTVVLLDGDRFGLDQMVQHLAGCQGFDAIHILSHGRDGALQLGSGWLETGNLEEHAETLRTIGAALAPHGNLLVYGCNVARSSGGKAFVRQLAALTRADLAASSTPVGDAAQGGNWLLDFTTGPVRTGVLFSAATAYAHVLAADITTVTYDLSTGVLTVTVANSGGAATQMGAGDTIRLSYMTIRGEGGTGLAYTLTSPDVLASSATQFSATLNATDREALALILNANGTSSTSGTVYRLAAITDWNATKASGDGADNNLPNPFTVSNVTAPTITAATYDFATGQLVVTGTGFTRYSGVTNDVDVDAKLTIAGLGGVPYALTSGDVEVASTTSFSVTLNTADRAAVHAILDQNGTSATDATPFNLAALNDWLMGASLEFEASDATSPITVSNYEAVAPTISSLSVNNTLLEYGETATVTIVFSEAIDPGSFTLADLTAENASLSALTTLDNITWTATLTANLDVDDLTSRVSLNPGNVQDFAGNLGSGITSASENYEVRADRPDMVSIVMSDTDITAGETALVTFTFSEAVTDFTAADVNPQRGSITDPVSADGGVTWTAVYKPNTGASNLTNVIRFNGTVIDADLNVSDGVNVDSANFTVNAVTSPAGRPVAYVIMDDRALASGQTSTVTFTFSEGVTGFGPEDIDLSGANGLLGAITEVTPAIYTAVFTPNPGITDLTNVITVNNTGVQDLAANAGVGSSSSLNFTIDTEAPTVSAVDVSDLLISDGDAGGFFTVTVDFNEAMDPAFQPEISFDPAVLTTLSGPSGAWSLGNTRYAVTYAVADGGVNIASVAVDVIGGVDAAGNGQADYAPLSEFAIDTLNPTVSLNVVDASLNLGDMLSVVTLTFSEAPSGLDLTDFSADHGSFSALVPTGNPLVFEVTYTADAGFVGTDTVSINTNWQDGNGNNGALGASDTVDLHTQPIAPVLTATDLHTIHQAVPISSGDNGPGTPFPSLIPVAGLDGLTVLDVDVQLVITHTYPTDLNILLEGPAGQNVLLLSEPGTGDDIAGVAVTIDDEAPTTLPFGLAVAPGSYQPTNGDSFDDFGPGAPVGPFGSALSVFDGLVPNGNWSLYVYDQVAGDTGSIDSWDLMLTTEAVRSYAENDPPITGLATFAASDADSLISSALVVISGGLQPGDVLTYTGAVPGISANWNAGAGALSLTGTTTPGDYQTALDSITFSSTSDNPGSGTRTLTWTLTDNWALDSAPATTWVTVTPVNDAPSLTGDLTATVTEGASVVLTTTDIGFSDPDDVASGVTFSVSYQVGGKVRVGGVDATSFTPAQLAAGQVTFLHDGSEAATASFDLSVEDGNEDLSTPVSSVFNLTVTPVNDAPVLRAASVANYPSGGLITIPTSGQATPYPATVSVAGVPATILEVDVYLTGLDHTFPDDLDIVLVGPGGQNVMLMSDVGGGVALASTNLVFFDAATSSLPDGGPIVSGGYRPTNISDISAPRDIVPSLTGPFGSALSVFNGTNPNGTWSLYVSDDTDVDSGQLASWLVRLTVDTGTTVQSYTENGPAVANLGSWYVGDADTANLQSASVVISGGFQSGDVLGFVNTPQISGSWDLPSRTLTLTGSATAAQYQAALTSVTFSSSSDNPGNGNRTLTWRVNDGGTNSPAATSTVQVTPVNDTPVVSAGLSDQGAAVFETFNFQIPAGSFTDPDGDTLSYSVTGLPAWLSFNPTTGTFSGTPGAGNIGFADITVTATDPSLASTSDVFRVTVAPPTDRVYIQGADIGGGVRTLTANTTFMAPPATSYAWYRFDGISTSLVASGAGFPSINVGTGDNFALYTVVVSHAGGTVTSGAVDPQAATPPAGILQSTGNPGNDTLPAAPIRAQTFIGYHGLDTITGTNGADWIDGGPDVDSMVGGLGNDTYIAHDALDVIVEAAGGGTDLVMSYVTVTLPSEVENLTLVGANAFNGTGNSLANLITGNSNANLISGLGGNDTINAGGGNDWVDGGADNDTLNGGDGGDTLLGGTGNDSLLGAAGNDSLDGGENDDKLDGGAAADVLLGGNGNDSLIGGGGNDTLTGGAGTDTLNGGTGADTFVLDNSSVDVIQSFVVVDDTFQLSKSLFGALLQAANTPLNGAAFWSGTAAHDADDRIIYNPATYALWYDADGNGAGAAVQIATLVGGAVGLTQADFMVVA